MKPLGLLLILLLCINYVNAQDHGRLQITINNVKETEGSLQVAIFNSDDSFMEDALEIKSVKVQKSGNVEVEFSGLPFGIYSLSIFHDINENLELDTNFLGIPKEPFGFSNDAMGAFGPPSFEKASIKISQPDTQTKVKLRSL